MTEELSYETIPNEFWPKCDWCGHDIGEGQKFKSNLRICNSCYFAVCDIIRVELPSILYRIFSEYETQSNKTPNEHFSGFDPDEMLKEAIQNIKKAQES